MFDLSVYYLFLQYFDTVGWVFSTCKNRLPYNLYCVGGDVKHCSVNPADSTDVIIDKILWFVVTWLLLIAGIFYAFAFS